VSPRKSRRKSACFSSTSTSTPARANNNPAISPAGPPPAMQHCTENFWAAIDSLTSGNGIAAPLVLARALQ
jgi:hypothetical protein